MWRGSNGTNRVGMLRNEVDRLFTDFFGPTGDMQSRPAGAAGVFPALNVWERDNELFVEAELPGLGADDVDISLVANQLVIKGRRTDFEEQSAATYHRRERGTGEFLRTVELPVAVEPKSIEAKLSNGILLLRLPKADAAKPRKIQVKS